MRRLSATLMAAALAVPSLAQSLAEIAARDHERRARQGSRSAPAYPDADLRTSRSPSPSSTSEQTAASPGWVR